MSNESHIEWTDATWNPVVGCAAVSPGCTHCYAATMTKRLTAMGKEDYAGLIGDTHFNGVVRCLPDRIDIPLRWKKPRMVFVNSMSDLFHPDVPDEFIAEVFEVMASHPLLCRKKHEHDDDCDVADWNHTYQVLTKRPERMAELLPKIPELCQQHFGGDCAVCTAVDVGDWPLENVWLGTSCENQEQFDIRVPSLCNTPAAIRFLSLEPLLAPIRMRFLHLIDWVIVGGESGPNARPCSIASVRFIVDQCNEACVACFVKQLGSAPYSNGDKIVDTKALMPERRTEAVFIRYLNDRKGGDPSEWPVDLRVRQFPNATVKV